MNNKPTSVTGLCFVDLIGKQFHGYEVKARIFPNQINVDTKTVVLRAKSPEGDVVALKFATSILLRAPDCLEQMKVEADVHQRLTNHRVVPCLGFIDDEYCLVTRFVDGQPLCPFFRMEKTMSLRTVLNVCDVYEELHQMGYVHGDIKPANWLLTRDNRVRVLDFGTVTRIGSDDSGKFSKKHTLGTKGFISPEQELKLGCYLPSTDIYGLCATLLYLVHGACIDPVGSRLPFVDFAETHLPDQFDHGLVQLLKKGLAIEPSERFQTIAELKDEIAKLLA